MTRSLKCPDASHRAISASPASVFHITSVPSERDNRSLCRNTLIHSDSPRGFYIRTFGCQMNEYDSLKIQRPFAALIAVEEIGQADVIFLNTCSVREKAEQKVHSFMGSLRRLKNTKPHMKIIAGGCVAQQLGEKLLDRFDHLDMVIGTRG